MAAAGLSMERATAQRLRLSFGFSLFWASSFRDTCGKHFRFVAAHSGHAFSDVAALRMTLRAYRRRNLPSSESLGVGARAFCPPSPLRLSHPPSILYLDLGSRYAHAGRGEAGSRLPLHDRAKSHGERRVPRGRGVREARRFCFVPISGTLSVFRRARTAAHLCCCEMCTRGALSRPSKFFVLGSRVVT